TISFRIVKNSEPISLAEGSFAFMRLVLQQPVKGTAGIFLSNPTANRRPLYSETASDVAFMLTSIEQMRVFLTQSTMHSVPQ
ncbi:hypothetical protein ACUXQ2_006307, partial [Cupriavidus metallidurans]